MGEPMDNPCWIIGVLDGGPDLLTPAAGRLLAEADLVIGNPRLLDLFDAVLSEGAERRSFAGRLRELPVWMENARAEGRRTVILATGDPYFFGIAGHLRNKLPADAFRVLPQATTPQHAFALLGLSWTDARLVSVHSGDGGDWTAASGPDHPLYSLHRALLHAEKIAVLTSPVNTPNRIIRLLQHLRLAERFEMIIAERLTTPEERIVRGPTVDQLESMTFQQPNVVILLRRDGVRAPASEEPVLGIPDRRFLPDGAESGLITRQEIRAVCLGYLALRADSTVWDIGAGSGSVGLEAARLCPDGRVFAIEKNSGRVQRIRDNQAGLRIANFQVVEGRAPDGLEGWPDPDAVFIGGSGGVLGPLIRLAADRLRPGGRLVMNFITLDNLHDALAVLKDGGWSWRLTQIQINRDQPILQMRRLVPESPVWIVTAHREPA